MIERITDVDSPGFSLFDDIIDVRSPGEFAEDRIPGAINLPVLDNAERAEVGTIYAKESHFLARRIGAAIVARNISRHLETALAEKPAKYRPLVYCWRGGMRSNAMATVLSQIGWRVGVLDGGYKTWRRSVVYGLHDAEQPLRVVLLDGQTGTAKSELLARVNALGVQTVDLEAIARHRGSVFGAMTKAQPPQKLFESGLWRALSRLDPSRPIVIEAESNRIGACVIPRRLWREMLAAPRIVVTAQAEARARYLTAAYADLVGDAAALNDSIERLRPFHAKECIEEWLAMAERKEHVQLAAALMREHYDPLYDRSRKRRSDEPMATFRLSGFADADLAAAARRLARIVEESALTRRASHLADQRP